MVNNDVFRPYKQNRILLCIPTGRTVADTAIGPLDENPVLSYRCVNTIDVSDKACHKFILRIFVYPTCGPGLFDVPLINDDNFIGNIHGFILIMRHKDAGNIKFIVHLTEPACQTFPYLQIQGTERLIQ